MIGYDLQRHSRSKVSLRMPDFLVAALALWYWARGPVAGAGANWVCDTWRR
jgi:hypothetical protein